MNTDQQYILGIDISKNNFDVALLLPNRKQKNKKFSNNPKGFQALALWLEKWSVDHLNACMEATNVYGYRLAEFLYYNGFDVSIVNPVRIKELCS